MSLRIVAVTAGDVSGIGPEIVARAAASVKVAATCIPLIIGHPEILRRAIKLAGLNNQLLLHEITSAFVTADQVRSSVSETALSGQKTVCCWNPASDEALSALPGITNAAAGNSAFQYLTAAIELAQRGVVDAIATAPLNKAALHMAGHHFPGHTEILADRCGVEKFAMMLYLPQSRVLPLRSLIRQPGIAGDGATHGLSIAHVTLHTSIASVPRLLTTASVEEKIQLMHGFLTRIGCARRSIGVCALNPHGGENGLLGDEETRIIAPAVRSCAGSHISVTGPHPVDTLVRRAVAGEFDGLVAMYHDQGHIPVKLIGFDSAVNITLGLPIVRTSPTHGTAFDRAWNSQTPADAAGMIEAVLTAVQLC